jgi:hypothetical protein
MKVKELIEMLSKHDQELELVMSQNDGEYESDLKFLKIEVVDSQLWLFD